MAAPLELSHNILAETVDRTLSGQRDEGNLARLPRLEADRRARGAIEPHATRSLAVEFQRRIGIKEMIMRADLDRTIARIGNGQCEGLAALVELDFARFDDHF